MRTASAIVIAAMDEEVQPLLQRAQSEGHKVGELSTPADFRAWVTTLTPPRILIVQSGVGMTAAASALTWALEQVATREVFSVGTAGGLGPHLNVGDVVVGSEYRYGTVDATAFGYAPGQVPGQPEVFTISERVATTLEEMSSIQTGLMLSCDSFVTAEQVEPIRHTFPGALTTDMETAALAQVSRAYGVGFTAIRAVSDLCGPKAGQDFHMSLDKAAEASIDTLCEVLSNLEPKKSRSDGRRRQFTQEALQAAMYCIVAMDHDLEPIDADPELVEALKHDIYRDPIMSVIELVTAGRDYIKSTPNVRLSSQRYDRLRAEFIDDAGITSSRGRQVWPPTSQTVMKRFGGLWNKALESIGLTGSSGRRSGGIVYSDSDYCEAIALYHAWITSQGRHPSYAGYQDWLSTVDERYPSGASVRQHFGTWADAILSLYT